jgi:hypothetical protein
MPVSNTQDLLEAESSLKGVHVLVVEDAWHLAKALKSALTEVGMDVAGPAATIAGPNAWSVSASLTWLWSTSISRVRWPTA